MKRLMYIPGIWSLGLMLPLCMWYLFRQGVWKQERCITMTFPIPQDQRDQYPFPPLLTPSELRQEWTKFTCNERGDETEATLLAFRDSLRELESLGDTMHGIHIHFGPETKYATIINAIDICSGTVRAWELDDHDLWALHYPEPKPEKAKAINHVFYMDCRMGSCIVELRPSASERLETNLSKTWIGSIEPYWMTWSLLLLTGVLALRSALRISF